MPDGKFIILLRAWRVTTKVIPCARRKSERCQTAGARVDTRCATYAMLVLEQDLLSLRVAHFPN